MGADTFSTPAFEEGQNSSTSAEREKKMMDSILPSEKEAGNETIVEDRLVLDSPARGVPQKPLSTRTTERLFSLTYDLVFAQLRSFLTSEQLQQFAPEILEVIKKARRLAVHNAYHQTGNIIGYMQATPETIIGAAKNAADLEVAPLLDSVSSQESASSID